MGLLLALEGGLSSNNVHFIGQIESSPLLDLNQGGLISSATVSDAGINPVIVSYVPCSTSSGGLDLALGTPATYAGAGVTASGLAGEFSAGSVIIPAGVAGSVTSPNFTASPSITTWTLEGWFYPTVADAMFIQLDIKNNNVTGGWYFNPQAGGTNTAGWLSTKGFSTGNILAPTLNAWNHFCLQYTGGTLYAFVNGAVITCTGGTTDYSLSGTCSIGGEITSNPLDTLYVSELSLTRTARFPTTGFAPPTAPLMTMAGDASTGGFAYSGDRTETASPSDAPMGALPMSVLQHEAGGLVVSDFGVPNAAGSSFSVTGASNWMHSYGNGFVATSSGQLGKVSFRMNQTMTGSGEPTVGGSIQLWQLSTNDISTGQPNTLLGTLPGIFPANLPASTAWITFDLSSVSGMSVTAGTGYFIGFFAGSDWNNGVTHTGGMYFQYAYPFNGMMGMQQYGGSAWSSANVPDMALTMAGYGASAVSASTTMEYQYLTEAGGLVVSTFGYEAVATGGNYNTLLSTSSYLKAGSTFIANATGHLGTVTFFGDCATGPAPTVAGSVELWQLSSNSVTSPPSSLIATLSGIMPTVFPASTGGKVSFDLSGAANFSVMSGVGYALVVARGSDWNYPTTAAVEISGKVGPPAAPFGTLSCITFYLSSWSVNTVYGSLIEVTMAGYAVADATNGIVGMLLEDHLTATDTPVLTPALYGDQAESVHGPVQHSWYPAISRVGITNYSTGANGRQGNTFQATSSGQIGIVQVWLYRWNVGSIPATPGAVELWAGGASVGAMPTSLAASVTIDLMTIPTSPQFVAVDFSGVSGAVVTAGSWYWIGLRTGSDWGGANQNIVQPLMTQGQIAPTQTQLAYQAVGGTWYWNDYTTLFTVQMEGNGDTITPLISNTATEAVTLADGQDFAWIPGGSNGYLTETVTASDAASITPWLYGDQAESVHALMQLDERQFIARIGAANVVITEALQHGVTFMASASGTLGWVSFYGGQNQGGLPAPSTLGAVEVYSLAGAGPTYAPVSLLGSISLDINALPYTGADYVFDFTSQNIAITAGSGYYIGVRTGTDWIYGTNRNLYVRYCNGSPNPALSAAMYCSAGTWWITNTNIQMTAQLAGNADTLVGNLATPVSDTEVATAADALAGGYTVAMPESATGADLPASAAAFPVADYEGATGADAPVGMFTSPQAIVEAGNGTDAKDSTYVVAASDTELATGWDSPVAATVVVGTGSEGGSAADSNTSEFTLGVADAEAAAGSDTLVASATFASALTESGALADTTGGVGPEFAVIAEAVTAADAGATSGAQHVSIPEPAAAADDPSSTCVASAVELEAATGADAPAGANATAAAGSEAASVTDSPVGQNVTSSAGTDATIASDAATGGNVTSGAVTESATAADVLSAAAAFAGAQAESSSSADAITAAAAFVSAIAEAVNGADAETVAGLLVSAIMEAVTAGYATYGVGPQGVTVSEVAAGSDLQVAAAEFIAAATAAVVALDATDAANVGGVALQSEVATATDAPAALALFVAVLTEAATGADVPAATAVFVADAAGATMATDLAGVVAAFVGAAVENASGVDTVSAFWVAYASLTESSAVADAIVLMGQFVGAVAEAAIGADIGGAWTGVTRAMVEAVAGIDAGSATMVGAATQLEVSASNDLLAGASTMPVVETEAVSGADGAAALFSSPQAIAEVTTAGDGKAGQLAAIGANSEPANALDAELSTMAAVASTGEAAFAADTSAGTVAFTLVVAESGGAADSGIATFSAVAAALEAIAGVDWQVVVLSAAAEIVVGVTAADWLGATTVADAAAVEAVVALDATGGEAGQWVGIYEVVSATESGIVELARLAFGLEDVSTTDLVLANVNFHVGTVEYVMAVDLWTGVLWVFDHRFVVSGAGRSFSVQRGGISPVAMLPRHFEVTEAGTT